MLLHQLDLSGRKGGQVWVTTHFLQKLNLADNHIWCINAEMRTQQAVILGLVWHRKRIAGTRFKWSCEIEFDMLQPKNLNPVPVLIS